MAQQITIEILTAKPRPISSETLEALKCVLRRKPTDSLHEVDGDGAGIPHGIVSTVGFYNMSTGEIEYDMGIAPKEKRFESEQVKARYRPPAEEDMAFYNQTRWRKYTPRFRARHPWCEIHMLYVLVNELGLEDIVPWFSKLDNEIKLRFLKRKGYEGEILSTDVTDHIIPIKPPFHGSKWHPRNHQGASHRYHNMKRRMEKDEIAEEYYEQDGLRLPLRMKEKFKRYSDPRGGQIP